MRLFVWPEENGNQICVESVSHIQTHTYSASTSLTLLFSVSALRITANGKCNATRKLLKWVEPNKKKNEKTIEHFRQREPRLDCNSAGGTCNCHVDVKKTVVFCVFFFLPRILSLLAIFKMSLCYSSGIDVIKSKEKKDWQLCSLWVEQILSVNVSTIQNFDSKNHFPFGNKPGNGCKNKFLSTVND